MLIFKKLYTVFILILFLSNCAHFTNHGQYFLNAKKAYSRGDYDQTTKDCIASLRNNINYKPSYELLNIVFPKTIDFHHKKIDRTINSRDYFKWDIVVNELEILINLIDNIESLNLQAIINKSNIRNYNEEIQEAKLKAAETHYQYGTTKMNSENKDELRVAAIAFKKSLGYISDYKESKQLYEICRESATIKLGFLPFKNNSGKNKYGDISKTISNELITRLMTDEKLMEFIDIINREQIDLIIEEQKLSHSGLVDDSKSIELGKIAGINMMIVGEITQLIINTPKRTVDKNILEKRVISSTTTYTDSDGNKRKRNNYKNVKCTVKKYTQTADSKILGGYQILDTKTAEILFSGNVEGKYEFKHTWATVKGDKRAMDFTTKQLTNKNAEKPPEKDQMVYSALEKLIDNLYLEIKTSIQ